MIRLPGRESPVTLFGVFPDNGKIAGTVFRK
jgi:hypothetical protein